jgi:toxin-antitoxin system PIN domain toxin
VTRALLAVNVLLALLDSDHVDHQLAHTWLDDNIDNGWASCPITENGFVRIIAQPRYPSPVAPAEAISLLDRARHPKYHEFWPCDVSLLDDAVIDRSRLHGSRQVTDAYLLGLAVAHGGTFVTFDRAISTAVVAGAFESHLVVLS